MADKSDVCQPFWMLLCSLCTKVWDTSLLSACIRFIHHFSQFVITLTTSPMMVVLFGPTTLSLGVDYYVYIIPHTHTRSHSVWLQRNIPSLYLSHTHQESFLLVTEEYPLSVPHTHQESFILLGISPVSTSDTSSPL